MTPESEFKATPEQIARITQTAIQQLAKTHIIITKDELRDLIAKSVEQHSDEMWELVVSTFNGTAVQMQDVLTPEQLQGFQLGGNMIERMRAVIKEENAAVYGSPPADHTPTTA